MNSSGEPAFATAFCTVSGEHATRIWTLAALAGAAFTVAAKPCAACSSSPPLSRARASARLAGGFRGAAACGVAGIGVAGTGMAGIEVARGPGVIAAGRVVVAGAAVEARGRGVAGIVDTEPGGMDVTGGRAATLVPALAGVRPQRYHAAPTAAATSRSVAPPRIIAEGPRAVLRTGGRELCGDHESALAGRRPAGAADAGVAGALSS